MQTLAPSLLVALLLAAPMATPDTASAETLSSRPETTSATVVVIGPFPLEVHDGLMLTEPLVVEVDPTTYFNLGFFEVDVAAGALWPWGLGLVPATHVRFPVPLASAR